MDRFDWSWPAKIDRQAVEELFSLSFIDEAENAILVGPNGTGKSMILKNIAHHAIVRGHTVRFTTASDMLADLAAQDSPSALARRMRRWAMPKVLCIDEVGCAPRGAVFPRGPPKSPCDRRSGRKKLRAG